MAAAAVRVLPKAANAIRRLARPRVPRVPARPYGPAPPPPPRAPALRPSVPDVVSLALTVKFPVLGVALALLPYLLPRKQEQPGGDTPIWDLAPISFSTAGMKIYWRREVSGTQTSRCSDNSAIGPPTAAVSDDRVVTINGSTYGAIRNIRPVQGDTSGFTCEPGVTGVSRQYLTFEIQRRSDGAWLEFNGNITFTTTRSYTGFPPNRHSIPPPANTATIQKLEDLSNLQDLLPTPQPTVVPLPPSVVPEVPVPEAEPIPEQSPRRVPIAPPRVLPAPVEIPDRRVVPVPGPGPGPLPSEQPLPRRVPVAPPVSVPRLPSVPDGLTPLRRGDSAPMAAPEPPPRVTPPGERVIAGVPIKGPVRDVPPTLEGIAAETGRIERKLEALMRNEAGPGDTTDLLQLLTQVWEFLSSAYGAGGYQITGQCHVDSNGDPLDPLTAAWDAGFGLQSLVSKKLDALALLLQHHKNLAGHICRRPPPSAPVVSVVFDVDDP